MLDRKYIVEHADDVKQNCIHRGVDADVDQLVQLESERREKQQQAQELNRQANEVSKSIGQAKDADSREARKEEGRRLREQKDAVQAEVERLEDEVLSIHPVPKFHHSSNHPICLIPRRRLVWMTRPIWNSGEENTRLAS